MLSDHEIALKAKEVFIHLLKQFIQTIKNAKGRSLNLREVEREEELISFGIILGINKELTTFREEIRKKIVIDENFELDTDEILNKILDNQHFPSISKIYSLFNQTNS